MTDKPVLPSEQLAAMCASFPGLVWVSGPDKKYLLFNANWVDFRGRSPDDAQDTEWINDIHPDDRERYLAAIEEGYKSHRPLQLRYRLKSNHADYRWLQTNLEPLYGSDGNFSGYIASSVDVHDLTQEMMLRDEFIDAASHELKIPVTTIKVYAQLLEDFFERGGDEKHLDFLKKVNKQVIKLTRLINNLGESNELHQGRLSLHKSEFDLNKLVLEEISRAQAESFKHNIRLKGYLAQNINGDRERLAQAFTNVLDNAVKFSPDSDIIEVTLTEFDKYAIISVRDYGIGVTDKEKAKIFERFYRGHDNIKNTFPGVGLGLYISSQIIKAHGGEIAYEVANPGSIFKVTLPYDNRY